jgi:galactokinase
MNLDGEEEYEVFVPGRLCLLGEHTDWAGEYRASNPHISCGATVVCATNEGLFARCKRDMTFSRANNDYDDGLDNEDCFYMTYTTKSRLESSIPADNDEKEEESSKVDYITESKSGIERGKSFKVELSSRKLKSIAAQGGFFSYIAGTAYVILEKYLKRKSAGICNFGICIHNFKTTLPMRKGLSSSAAVCVLIAKCFDAVYGLDLDMKEIMEVAYLGELASPSKCGRMDQASNYTMIL